MARQKKEQSEEQIIDKDVLLKKTLRDINNKFPDSLKLGSEEKPKDRIPFSVEDINKLTGGGIPSGTFSVIWGNKSCGKTTVVYTLIAESQKQNKVCAFLDLENSFDQVWATKMGVDTSKLLVGHFNTAEEAMDTLIKLAREKVVNFIVVDSIQSLSPKGEQEDKSGHERSLEDDTMALLARKLSQFFRISAGGVYRGDVAVLMVGQARMNLGGYVALETLSGGHALQHWSTITLHMRRGQKVDAPVEKYKETFIDIETKKERYKTKDRIVGFDCVLKLEKTKITSQIEGSEVHIPFYFSNGFTKPENIELKQQNEIEQEEEHVEKKEETNTDSSQTNS